MRNTTVDCNQSFSSSLDPREPYRTITLTILRIYPILFMLVGTVGNLLSVYVVLRSKLRRHSTFIYLAFLSIIDLIVLYTFCVNFILHAWFNIDLQQVSLIACKIFSFSIYFFPQTSAWILTAVSLDRVFALTRGVRKTRKIRLTYFILFSIFSILFLLNVQFFFYENTYRVSEPRSQLDPSHRPIYRIVDTDMDINVVQCSSENSEEYKEFYVHIWVYIDAIVNVYLPFTLMFLCSAIIFVSVLRTMGDANNTNKRLIARNLSTMLLSINAMFVILTGPIVFYLMFEKQMLSSNSYQCAIRAKAKYKMIKLFFIILMNANHTGNILVYCLTGTEFRTQLLFVIGKRTPMIDTNSLRVRTGTMNRESFSQTSRTSSRKQYYCTSTPRGRIRRVSEIHVSLDHNCLLLSSDGSPIGWRSVEKTSLFTEGREKVYSINSSFSESTTDTIVDCSKYLMLAPSQEQTNLPFMFFHVATRERNETIWSSTTMKSEISCSFYVMLPGLLSFPSDEDCYDGLINQSNLFWAKENEQSALMDRKSHLERFEESSACHSFRLPGTLPNILIWWNSLFLTSRKEVSRQRSPLDSCYSRVDRDLCSKNSSTRALRPAVERLFLFRVLTNWTLSWSMVNRFDFFAATDRRIFYLSKHFPKGIN